MREAQGQFASPLDHPTESEQLAGRAISSSRAALEEEPFVT